MCSFFLRDTVRRVKRPFGPKGSWLLGNLREVQRDTIGFLHRSAAQYGPDIQYYQIAFWNVYRLSHPDYNRHILQDNQRNYGKSTLDYDVLRRLSGNGLISNQGESWLQQRRLLQPLFHRRRIAALGDIMVQATADLLPRWHTLAQNKTVFDVNEAMTELTLDIVARALFSLDVRQNGRLFSEAFHEVNEYFGSLDPVFAVAPWLPMPRIRRFYRNLGVMNQFIYDIIARRRQQPQTGDQVDLLTLLLEARDEETGAGMDDVQIRDELITLLIAGHETTANLLAWTWYLLAQHPAARERLDEELAGVSLPSIKANGRLPTVADIPNLPFTEQLLKEALRLYPPAWFISRNAIDDDEIGGYPIPASSLVSVSTYLTHRHPDFWPQPDQFDPDRFTPAAEAARPRYAYLPFGGGPRLCIGNSFAMTEATLILATLAQQFRLTLATSHPVTPDPLITLRVKGGLQVIAQPIAAPVTGTKSQIQG